MPEDLDDQISGVAMLNDPIRRSLYQLVAGSPEAVSRDQAAEAVGIQRALAAFHLDKLPEGGLLEVEFRRLTGRTGPGAGRPAVLATGGDLVFGGEPTGEFNTYDARTGELLWQHQTGSGHHSSPTSYSVNGKQYIAVPVGWGGWVKGYAPGALGVPRGDSLVVFSALGRADRMQQRWNLSRGGFRIDSRTHGPCAGRSHR